MEIIGHRGASHEAPENTLASVNLAWSEGADAVEIDVFLTRDGQVVAIHDDTPERYGGPPTPVESMTAAELRRLDVGRWKDPRFAGERVPLLTEVLATIPSGKRLFVEIKSRPEIVPVLARIMGESTLTPSATAFISFDRPLLAALKQQLPATPHYWVMGFRKHRRAGQPVEWLPSAREFIAAARESNFDGLDLGNCRAIDAAFVRAVHRAKLGLYVWTVNSVAEARRLQAAGVDGIATDRPGWIRDRLSRPSNPERK